MCVPKRIEIMGDWTFLRPSERIAANGLLTVARAWDPHVLVPHKNGFETDRSYLI